MQRLDRPCVLCLVFLLGCFLFGCGGGGGDEGSVGGDPLSVSGVEGQATRGPISPLTQQGQPNDAPLPGVVIVVLRQNGGEAARQITDSQGKFKIGVRPGVYRVLGLAPNGSSGFPIPPAPQTVAVAANQYSTVNISYDTGIR